MCISRVPMPVPSVAPDHCGSALHPGRTPCKGRTAGGTGDRRVADTADGRFALAIQHLTRAPTAHNLFTLFGESVAVRVVPGRPCQPAEREAEVEHLGDLWAPRDRLPCGRRITSRAAPAARCQCIHTPFRFAGSPRAPWRPGGGGDSAAPWMPTTSAPLPPPRGLRPTVSCQRCRPQVSIGAKGPMLHEHQRCPKENFVHFAPQHYP